MSTSYNDTLDKRIYLVPQEQAMGYTNSGKMEGKIELLLDATTDVQVSYGAEVTTYFVNDKTDNTDHIRNQPRTISFNGVISNDLGLVDFVKSLASGGGMGALNLGVATNIDGKVSDDSSHPATLYNTRITESMKEKQMFSVYIPNIGVINNCAITRCTFRTDVTLWNSFSVSMELKEIRIPEESTSVPSVATSDTVSKTQTSSSGTTKVTAPPANVVEGDLENMDNLSDRVPSSAKSFPKSGLSAAANGIHTASLLGV